MNLSVWRDVRSRNRGRSRSGDMIVGLRDGNRIWRVSPDSLEELGKLMCTILFAMLYVVRARLSSVWKRC